LKLETLSLLLSSILTQGKKVIVEAATRGQTASGPIRHEYQIINNPSSWTNPATRADNNPGLYFGPCPLRRLSRPRRKSLSGSLALDPRRCQRDDETVHHERRGAFTGSLKLWKFDLSRVRTGATGDRGRRVLEVLEADIGVAGAGFLGPEDIPGEESDLALDGGRTSRPSHYQTSVPVRSPVYIFIRIRST
jgi:hypothetical protein